MTLNELTIRGFGKFHDRTFTFSDGINILYGKNESGKSTLHSFLRAMLFGMERARGRAAKTDFFAHFEPWFGDGAYGGTLKFTEDGHVYRLERNFSKNPLDLSITDETEGKEIPEPREFLSKLLGNLNVTAFDNTVSIGQLKSSTDAGLVNELKNYIANMNTSGNMSLNITKACDYLKDQRRAFERLIVQDAAKNYAANMTEIRKIEEALASPDYVNRISELTETKEAAATAQETLRKEREKLLQKAAADQQTLRGKRFEGREDITAFRGSCTAGLKEYEEAEKLASSRGTRNAAVLTVVLALISACAGFWFTGNTPEGFAALPLHMICWIAAGILAVISAFCFHTASARMQKAKDASGRFLDIVREHFPELLPPAAAAGPENLENCRHCMEQVEKETDGLLLICDSADQGGKMLQEVDSRLELLKTQQSDTEATIAAQQKSQWELERQLEHLSNLKNEASALKRVVAENDRLRTEIEAIDIARDTMTRLSTTIRDSFGLYLNRNASELIAGITGGIYTSLSIDQDLNVSLNTEKKLVPLEQVSSGTMDQVYLALRLASADLMRQDGVQLPLFLDDSFVNYDEDRLRTVLKWLPETFPDRQILVFSCHRREAQLLSANLIPYTLTEIA